MATVKVTTINRPTGGSGVATQGGNQGGGDSSGVQDASVLGFVLQKLFASKPRQPFNPFGVARKVIKNEEMVATVQRKIDADLAAGREISSADIQRLAKLSDQLARLQRKFEKQQKRKPQKFTQVGFPPGLTFDMLISLFKASPSGQKLLAPISQMLFPQFNPPQLTQGGSTMPFVVTPGADSSAGGFDFGGLLNSVIGAGGNIASAILGPRTVAAPGFQQASLVPAIPGALGALRGLLPSVGAVGAGALGGELADLFQSLTGGASSLDDTAAFTDPVPGSCRPKAHVKVNPCTGRGIWFTPRGNPLVFSGDLAACKRVDRVAKRLNKSMPRKHHHHRKSAKR